MFRATPGAPQTAGAPQAADQSSTFIELVSTTGVRGPAVLIYRSAELDETAFAPEEPTTARVYGLAVRVEQSPTPTGQVPPDACPEVWRTSTRFDADRTSAMAWIMAIAHRRAVDRLRSARDATPPPPVPPARSLGRRARRHAHQDRHARQNEATHVEAAQVREALARLGPAQLDVLELAYLETPSAARPVDLATILSTIVTARLPHEPEVRVPLAPTGAPAWPGSGRAAS